MSNYIFLSKSRSKNKQTYISFGLKRALFYLPLGIFCLNATLFASEPKKDTEVEGLSTNLISGNTDLTIVQNAKAEAEVAQKQIQLAKEQIKEEKESLESDAVEASAKSGEMTTLETADVVREKLETLETKEELIETAESLVEEKTQAYESITQMIERKLELLDNRKLPAAAFESEIYRISQDIRRLDSSKETIQRKKYRNKQEIASLEKHLESQRLLIALKGSGEPALEQKLKTVEERRKAALEKQNFLVEQEKLIDLQKEVAGNYMKQLREERWNRLGAEIFLVSSFHMSKKEVEALFVIFFVLLFLSFFAKRFKHFLKTDHFFGSKKIAFFYSKFLVLMWLGFVAFLGASFLGFHAFAIFIGQKACYLMVVGLVFCVAYKLFKGVVRRYIFKDTQTEIKEEQEQSKIQHPYFELSLTIISWSLLAVFLYLFLQTLELHRDSFDLFLLGLNYPLTTVGDVAISLKRIIFFVLIIWLSGFISRVLANVLSNTLYPRFGLDESIQYTVSVGIKYLMVIVGAFIGLQVLGVKMTALTVFAGTVGIGIGFGLQDIAKNFISGLIVLIERPIKIGDYVVVGDLPGRVKAIKARSTIIDTFDNISVVVPNSEFMSQRVVNWSHSDRVIRVPVPVGVAYGSDVDLVKKILLAVAEKHNKVLKRPAPSVLFSEFGDSSLNFILHAWTREPENRFGLRSDLNAMIDSEFRKHNITIPFPQRDLHFKSTDIDLFQRDHQKEVTVPDKSENPTEDASKEDKK